MISVILAAGHGTRIQALTAGKPKQMLLIHGEPIVARLIRQVSLVGATRHLLSTHTDSTMMIDFLRTLSGRYGEIELMPSLPSKGENLFALLRIAGSSKEDIVIAMGDSVFHESFVPTCRIALAAKSRADICFAIASKANDTSGRRFDTVAQRLGQKGAVLGVPYTGLAILRPHIRLALVELGQREVFTSISDAFNVLLGAGATASLFDVGEYFDVNTPGAYERCVAATERSGNP